MTDDSTIGRIALDEMRRAAPSVTEVADAVFGSWFRDKATWNAWFVFLRSLFGLPLDDASLALYRECTARQAPPPGGSREAWLIVGRRGGKSLALALVAVFLACFRDWSPYLVPGERATIMCLAADRKQARTIFRYCRALLREVEKIDPKLVESETAESVDLNNGITIEILAASLRGTRGYTVLCCLADEIAFWRDETSANPDTEILAAIRPSMSTIPDAMLLCASSPYARRGALWEAYRRYFGKSDAPALVWKAPTRTMNSTVPESVIAEAYERDPASAAAEYGAEFRTDVESFVTREVIDAATVPGRHELPPISGVRYVAFTDPAGGSGTDSFTLAIVHCEADGRVVLDAVRERRPNFSPDAVVADFAVLLKAYRVTEVTGDRYAGQWPAEAFGKHRIKYRPSERSKSDIYREMLPLLNAGRVELLDIPRIAAQFLSLERRTARGGRDSVDAPNGTPEDVANAISGAAVIAAPAASAEGGCIGYVTKLAEEAAAAVRRLPPPAPILARGSVEWAQAMAEADAQAVLQQEEKR